MPTLLTAGDGSNGANITSSNDNALTIQTGPNGAKVNAIALASDGTATMLKQPVLAASAVVSMVRVNTSNGYGSTGTRVRRFTNVTNGVNGCVIQGSDITFSNDATNGASATINTSGVYAITYGDCFSAATYHGISLNASSGATSILSLSIDQVLSIGTNGAADYASVSSWTGYLAAGAVIRAQTNNATTVGTAANAVQFTITRVA